MNIKRTRLFAFIVSLITSLPCLSNDELPVEGFLAGTLVHTPQGCRRIEQIQEGDLVTVYNFKRERFVSRKVVKPFSWHASSHLVLLVNDEFIGTGFEHKFYVPEQDDWVAARNLKAGDYLFIQSGKLAKIDAILRVQKHVDLHTLIIEKKLNFLVGAQGILAHNFIVIPFIVAWGAGMGTQIMWTAMLESFLSSAALYVALRCLPKNKPCQACADFLENNCNQSVFNNLCRPFFLTDLYSPPLFSPTIEKYEDTSCNSCTMPEINQQSKTSITLFRDAIFKNFDVSQQESNGINIRDLEVNFGESFEPRRLCYPYYPQHAIQKFTGPAYTNIFSACSPPPSVIATTYPRFMEGSAASEVAKKAEQEAKWAPAETKLQESAQKISNGQAVNTLKPLGKGSTGRTVPSNLNEEQVMKDIMENPYGGKILKRMDPLHDPRWQGWQKMQCTKDFINNDSANPKKTTVTIHYVGKFVDGVLTAVDDFKFKN